MHLFCKESHSTNLEYFKDVNLLKRDTVCTTGSICVSVQELQTAMLNWVFWKRVLKLVQVVALATLTG